MNIRRMKAHELEATIQLWRVTSADTYTFLSGNQPKWGIVATERTEWLIETILQLLHQIGARSLSLKSDIKDN